jgi:isopenicillin N synthase-like dioxygenase
MIQNLHDPSSCLPVIDLAPLIQDPGSGPAKRSVEALRGACHTPGFCYLTGHGVPADLEHDLLTQARQFFALPLAEKRQLAISNSPHFRGYTVLGGERTRGARDWREQLDLGAEEDAVDVGPEDPPWLRLRGPNQWPSSLPALRGAVLNWMQAMDRVGIVVLRALAVGLGQPADYFDPVVLPRGDPHLKIIRYPPQEPASDDDQGVGMHHDSGLVSFVLQDRVGGLQIRIGDRLLEIDPVTGSYVMNLGEMLQAATNGYLKATPHRVASPPAGSERISIAYFFHPRLDARFEPVELPPELAAQASGGENADPDDPVFSVFGENYLKIRLRSHADVATAHYAGISRGTR